MNFHMVPPEHFMFVAPLYHLEKGNTTLQSGVIPFRNPINQLQYMWRSFLLRGQAELEDLPFILDMSREGER